MPNTSTSDTALPAGIQFLARCFRSGQRLRQSFDRTIALHSTSAWSTPESQLLLLQQTVLYSPIPGHTFSHTRCKAFLRLLMHELDDANAPTDESVALLASKYCALKPLREQQEFLCLEMPDGKECVLRVSHNFSDLSFQIWDAGLVLYAMSTNRKSIIYPFIEGKNVLELGAGTGLCAAAFQVAENAFLTDINDAVVSNIRANVALNTTSIHLHTAVLDVRNLQLLREFIRNHQIHSVVAADVTYDLDLIRYFTAALDVSVEEGCTAMLFETQRGKETRQLVQEKLNSLNATIEKIHLVDLQSRFDYMIASDFSAVRGYLVTPKTDSSIGNIT